MTFFEQVWGEMHVGVLIDVALVAGLIYAVLVLLRRNASPALLRSLGQLSALFGLLYVLARLFELYLAQRLVEILSLVLIVSVIVVFQSDIRRLVDRLPDLTGLLRSGGAHSDRPEPSEVIDVLTETVMQLAEDRTGALIAVKGREPWDRHLHGGIPLDGRVSSVLLESLFEPHSPAHDGAVLLEDDTVRRFAVHLPLSTNLDTSSELGTRHAAGLGLTEHCDALVVIVSEERGFVSVARDGDLRTVDSASELKSALSSFWQARVEEQSSSSRSVRRNRRRRMAAISTAGAILLWFLFAYDPATIYRTMEIPIDLRNVPPDLMVEELDPSNAEVTLEGSEQAFYNLDPERLAFALDLEGIEDTTTRIPLTGDALDMPGDLVLRTVEPRSVRIDVRAVTSVRVPIRVPMTGALPDSLRLLEVTPSRDSVAVLVSPTGAPPPEAVPTAALDLSTIRESTTLEMRLSPPDGTVLAPGTPETESVRVEVERVAAGPGG